MPIRIGVKWSTYIRIIWMMLRTVKVTILMHPCVKRCIETVICRHGQGQRITPRKVSHGQPTIVCTDTSNNQMDNIGARVISQLSQMTIISIVLKIKVHSGCFCEFVSLDCRNRHSYIMDFADLIGLIHLFCKKMGFSDNPGTTSIRASFSEWSIKH